MRESERDGQRDGQRERESTNRRNWNMRRNISSLQTQLERTDRERGRDKETER